jgi:hypothetical protein
VTSVDVVARHARRDLELADVIAITRTPDAVAGYAINGAAIQPARDDARAHNFCRVHNVQLIGHKRSGADPGHRNLPWVGG